MKKKDYIFENIKILKGVGKNTARYLRNKKIETIRDLLLDFPYGYTDRTNLITLDKLEAGKISTIKLKVIKYNFPRIRNLPNRVVCEDEHSKIDIVFFNSREGYIRKVLPLNSNVVISGKVQTYKGKFQISNPEYISKIDELSKVNKMIPKYNLTDGITEKIYNRIISQVLENIPKIEEWYDKRLISNLNLIDWNTSIGKLHDPNTNKKDKEKYIERLAFDEIFTNLLLMSSNRQKINKIKKNQKVFDNSISKRIIENFRFDLTNDQLKAIDEIKRDLSSRKKMFRILQGDVGSGKTICAFISISNSIESGYQCALMAPTDILAKQHFISANKTFKNTNIKIAFLSGKTLPKDRKAIIDDLKNGRIDLIIGTHALFQKKISFKKLGLAIIDEQHKFGVRQRMNLSKKGGNNCDLLVMSATPIPRTMLLAIYGDMDVSRINKKPKNRKEILTYSKSEKKINEVIEIVKKQIKLGNQVFWICPLIKESNFINHSSVEKRYLDLKKIFKDEMEILHGNIDSNIKDEVLNRFLKGKTKIIISTTVIEVGIDFPNANLIIIENADKFGLAQLHQLRGRVGRGSKQGICILLFKESLSQKSIKRIRVLKENNDGFKIAEEDLKLRGFGDLIGFQQSGEKYFKFVDPNKHSNLFEVAEKYIKQISYKGSSIKNYEFLLKLYDRAEVLNFNE